MKSYPRTTVEGTKSFSLPTGCPVLAISGLNRILHHMTGIYSQTDLGGAGYRHRPCGVHRSFVRRDDHQGFHESGAQFWARPRYLGLGESLDILGWTRRGRRLGGRGLAARIP